MALETASKTDAQTGALNRAGFEEALERLLKNTRSISVVMVLDLDGFKAVSDAAGHKAGDEFGILVSGLVSCWRCGMACLQGFASDWCGAHSGSSSSPRDRQYRNLCSPRCLHERTFPDHGTSGRAHVRGKARREESVQDRI
ncbi:GGDEF domain-containing protein [Noviherbaspirillum aerium]|uniref:GGDEF domain-containing protein n=1 Tax=Noviherbaspirillum aerium TaxID=2588497 RepID=UPI00178C6E42|nr:GGDEF domain-containing protein [Noviherbaspirillum aerium]